MLTGNLPQKPQTRRFYRNPRRLPLHLLRRRHHTTRLPRQQVLLPVTKRPAGQVRLRHPGHRAPARAPGEPGLCQRAAQGVPRAAGRVGAGHAPAHPRRLLKRGHDGLCRRHGRAAVCRGRLGKGRDCRAGQGRRRGPGQQARPWLYAHVLCLGAETACLSARIGADRGVPRYCRWEPSPTQHTHMHKQDSVYLPTRETHSLTRSLRANRIPFRPPPNLLGFYRATCPYHATCMATLPAIVRRVLEPNVAMQMHVLARSTRAVCCQIGVVVTFVVIPSHPLLFFILGR